MSISEALGPSTVLDLERGPLLVRSSGSGDPILFLHGIIANGDLWRGVVADLNSDFRCIVPDWPLGSHRLAMPAGADFTLFGLADLVAETIDAIAEPVVLVANDTGGAIAQAVAARHPDKLRALVLTPCDAYDNFLPRPIKHLQVAGRTNAGLWVLSQTLRFRQIQRLPIAFGRLTIRPIPPSVMRSYTDPLRNDAAIRRDFAQLVRSISTRYTMEAAAGISAFRGPALLAWSGDRHQFFPIAHAHRLAAALPDARIEIVADSGPFIPEDQPHALASLIRLFVGR